MLTWLNLLFYVLVTLCLISAFFVIFAKNPIHSVLFLILVFANVVNLLVLLGIEFIGLIFLIVYVGAIAVLFLFIVMMLNIKIIEVNELLIRYVVVGAAISLIFLINMILLFSSWNGSFGIDYTKHLEQRLTDGSTDTTGQFLGSTWLMIYKEMKDWGPLPADWWIEHLGRKSNIVQLGEVLYFYSAHMLILASIVLLVAMIGAIVLTLQHKVNVKKQDLFAQTGRTVGKAIFLVRGNSASNSIN